MAALSESLDSLNLNTGGYYVVSRDYGSPNLSPTIVPRGRAMAERLVDLTSNGSRRISYTIECKGASADATIALLLALYAKLPLKGTAKNLVVTPTNATNSVTFVCLAVEGELPNPYDIAMDVGHVATISFTMIAEAYAYGPETTLVTDATFTPPDYVDLTIPGDFPTPLNVDYVVNAAQPYIHCMYLGLLPNQTTALSSLVWQYGDSFIYQDFAIATGNPATVTTVADHGLSSGQRVIFIGTTTTPATAGNSYVVTVTGAKTFTIPLNVSSGCTGTGSIYKGINDPTISVASDVLCYTGYRITAAPTELRTWEIDDRALPEGTYLALARYKNSAAGTVTLSFDDGTGTSDRTHTTSAATYYAMNPLGSVRLPFYKLTSATAAWSVPKLGWQRTSTPSLYLDYFMLMPTTWGWAYLHKSGTAGTYRITVDYAGIVYENYVASAYGFCGGLAGVGAQRLVAALGTPESGDYGGVEGTLTVKCIPRYALWR